MQYIDPLQETMDEEDEEDDDEDEEEESNQLEVETD